MNKKHSFFAALLCLLSTLTACKVDPPAQGLGVDEWYQIPRMTIFRIRPASYDGSYEWKQDTTVLSTDYELVFCAAEEGTYPMTLTVRTASGKLQHNFTIYVVAERVAFQAGINRVYEYMPAPGQFVNVLPEATIADTPETMRQKAEDALTQNKMITLGGYGGYVVFGFDHAVVNVAGQRDFCVYGNAFEDNAEPGIVQVSWDANQNGLPDDPWYELWGSEHDAGQTIFNYQITYQHINSTVTLWSDSEQQSDTVARNTFHQQDYFPLWLSADQLSFTGTRLPNNATLDGTTYLLRNYDWGYADNQPNSNEEGISFDIEWARDANGQPVHLPCINYVRVYTALNQVCGWIGETSTEVSGAKDLHIK